MPQIICHNCGRTRLVVEGKRKNCRGCGTKLTDQQQPLTKLNAKKEAAEKQDAITVAELAEMYPNQVTEIVTVAKADAAAEEFGDLNADDVAKAFPDAVVELVNKATAEIKDLKPDELAKVFPAIKELVTAAKAEGQKSILKLSAAKIAKLKEARKAEQKKG